MQGAFQEREGMTPSKTHLLAATSLFAVVTMLDIITTMIALNIGANEVNPFMQNVVSNPATFLVVKMLAIVTLAYLGWNIEQRCEGVGVIALTLASALTVFVVHNNLSVIVSLI